MNGNFDYIGDRLYALGLDVTAPEWGIDENNFDLDASAGIQNAVNSLINTGGNIILPSNRRYAFSNTVLIRSFYPINILSDMGSPSIFHIATPPFTNATQGYIKPIADLPDGFFKWQRPAGAQWYEAPGPYARGLVFADVSGAVGSAPGTFSVHSALNFADNLYGRIENIACFNLKGRAMFFGNAQCWVSKCFIRYSGDTNKPVIHLDNSDVGAVASVIIDRLQQEVTYNTNAIKVEAGDSLSLNHSYMEQESSYPENDQVLITGAGNKNIRNCDFGRNANTYIEFLADEDTLWDTTFSNAHTAGFTEPFFTWSGNSGSIKNVTLKNAANQIAHACTISGIENDIEGLRAIGCGNINIANVRNRLRAPVVRESVSTEPYQLVLHQLTKCHDAYVKGGVTNAIQVGAQAICENATVEITTANKNGIVAAFGSAKIQNCHPSGASGTGLNLVYASGCQATGNSGYPVTANATDDLTGFSSTATHNAESGTITCPNLGAAPDHVLTVNNSLVSTGSRILASVFRGTDSIANYRIREYPKPANGSFTMIISPVGGTNGTFNVAFQVVNS